MFVDEDTLESAIKVDGYSPLVGLVFGVSNASRIPVPVAYWVPAVYRLTPLTGVESLTLEDWLGQKVVPTKEKVLSREELITFVRDQDGGAHSDPDTKLLKSSAYIELVNSFPISKKSFINNQGKMSIPWEMLPAVTLPILRQIAHELLSAIYSQSDIKNYIWPPPSLICIFDGDGLEGVYMPDGYVAPGKVNGKVAVSVPYPNTS